jgi:hypothetical protein
VLEAPGNPPTFSRDLHPRELRKPQVTEFRRWHDFCSCLTRRGDTLFEITDAMLCENGPVTSPVDLTLLAEHRRGHGALLPRWGAVQRSFCGAWN